MQASGGLKNECDSGGVMAQQQEAGVGMSRLTPLPENSAVNKSLAKGPTMAKALPSTAFNSHPSLPFHFPPRHGQFHPAMVLELRQPVHKRDGTKRHSSPLQG